jgi:hypothetical protein
VGDSALLPLTWLQGVNETESEVRGLLEELWKIPSNGEKLLADAVEKNRDVRGVLHNWFLMSLFSR